MTRDMQDRNEVRCECGSLMARLTHKGVEVKCRRCKRVWVIPLYEKKGGGECRRIQDGKALDRV